MYGKTDTFTLNNAWKNLLAQAVADGYDGPAVAFLTITNFNDTVAYLHFGSSTQPATPAEGLGLSKDPTVGPGSNFSPPVPVDLSKTWIHTAGNQSFVYGVFA